MKTSGASAPEPPGALLGETAAAWACARRVRVGGIRVRYREAGSGPAIVLVHGLGVSADYWYRNGPSLAAAGYRVLAPDLPGFGRTEGPPGGLSVREHVAATLAWADAMGLAAPVYVGHSLSCQVALELAAAYPGRAGALVLAAPTGDPRPHRLLRQAWGLVRDIPREPFRLAVEVGRAYLQAGFARVWRTWRLGAEENPMPLLGRVRTPALVVVGTRDPVVHPGFARALAQGLPAGRLEWIPGGTHGVIFSQAAQFNRATLDFLSTLP